MVNIGIVGLGYWGPNLVRNFTAQSDAKVVAVADNRRERFDNIRKNYPDIKCYVSVEDVINDSLVDAIIIATPVFTHFDFAKKALLAGKHVLIEKPMADTSAHCQELIDIASQKNLTLMVDHTFLYTGAIQKIKELIDSENIGKIRYFDSTRINLGLFQPDINVLWDLAPHDLSILNYLNSETPYSINATGVSHTNNGIENIGYMTVNYESDFIAHFHCSWTSPVKVRQTLIGGDNKMILYNDIEPSEKVKVYNTGYTHSTDEDKRKILVDYRTGDISIPKLSTTEALYNMAKDFINSISNSTEPLSNSLLGLQVVTILEASQTSIKNNGKEVKFANFS